jgi:hypothetical protein
MILLVSLAMACSGSHEGYSRRDRKKKEEKGENKKKLRAV